MGRLFSTSHHSNYRLLIAALLSLALIAVDQRSSFLSPFRYVLSYATGLVQQVAYSPFGLSAWVSEGYLVTIPCLTKTVRYANRT